MDISRILIWGTGGYSEKCVSMIEGCNKPRFEVLAFVDNDNRKWGDHFHDKKIVSPSDIGAYNFDFLVIGNSFEYEIRKQIKRLNNCDITKTLTYKEFCSWIYAVEQSEVLNNKARSDWKKSHITDENRKCVVYTALIGKGDVLKSPEFLSDTIEYICFTNNKELRSDTWKIKYVSNEGLSDVMLARRIKILPWEYFESTDCLLFWVDAKFLIIGDVREIKEKYWNGAGILCFPHYERKCICDETAALVSYRNSIKDKVIIQTATYLNEGYPIDNGLYETGCLVRDCSNVKVIGLMEKWWEELVKHTYRDQLSFPYVCWKNNYYPDVSDIFIEHNEYLIWKR